MEAANADTEHPGGEKQVRLPYHAPELIKLGEIGSITQCGGAIGNDAMHGGFCAS